MRVSLYKGAVVLAAGVGMLYTARHATVSDWAVVAFLAALRFAVEELAFRLPVLGSGSLAFTLVFAAVLLDGPLTGAIVAIAGSITRQDIEANKSLLTMAFNVGQLALTAIVGGFLFLALGQTPLLTTVEPPPADVVWFVSSLFVTLAMASLNIGFVGTAIALTRGVSLQQVWRESFKDYIMSLFALALLGMVLAELIVVSGIPGTLLLVVPFAVAWQTFQVFQQQSEAYRGTIRCLVAAIEAKDPYTRGHSERVAWYARLIAEESGLPDYEVQRVEWAALLHDVGKVAVAKATLTKPGSLTQDEYSAIREHPSVAAAVLQEIDFLAEVVPYVEAHHERLDGLGYPRGISGESLPFGARILAVADCFDAMTSERAYRAGLSFEEAVAELQVAAGVQLDSACIDSLLSRVDGSVLRRVLGEAEQDHAS